MSKELTEDEKFVRKEVEKIWPQLQINEQKILTANYKKHGGDLMAVAVEMFLNKPIEQQLETIKMGKLENFITYIANLQAKSSYSHFWRHYRKFAESTRIFFTEGSYKDNQYRPFINPYEEEEPYNDKLNKCMKKAVADLDPFHRMLVQEKIMNNLTYQDIADKYDIPKAAVGNGMIRLRKVLKKKCKHFR